MGKAKYDTKKIILLILLIIVLLVGGVLVIDLVGRLLGVQVSIPLLNSVKERTLKSAIKRSESVYLLEREELAKKEERIGLMEEVVLNRENELKSHEIEVNKKFEAIKEREKELDKKVEMLDSRDKQYKDKTKNIREQAVKLYQMPPEDAAMLLEKLPETDIVDILRAIDSYSEELGANSTAPYMLKLLKDINKDKAAGVLAKLKFESEEKYSGVDILEDQTIEVPPAP